ncbi:4Fe-4S binding protein [Desulfosporosinus sp. Sb-LF]|uniref:4Fe-4S dicluster domain-containing protein n=1 Tax=Desulfosporosinus sp. Sb-LF TaxID=2560027 RepID=UPI00107F7B7A|nr:4Fe-4S binding protein [Desulfosporosinus sp. Sb-LF]TGE34306.1 4Fe-4S dicluster domain-containing protein [Desulfosporosinus sp. Sb-LF]
MTCKMVYHNGNCLNTKKPYARACRLCIENCPHQAITEYRQLEPRHCTECGVCMAACPSDGFVDQTMDKLHDYLFESNEIVLNCPQSIALGFEIPCLGMLDRDGWMTLMLLAKEKSVTILTGNCAECEDRRACASSVQTFKLIHVDWPEHSPIRIQVRPDKDAVEPQTLAAPSPTVRPAEGIGWRQKGKEKIEEWLPNLAADETYPIPKYRQWLIESLGHLMEEKIPFRALFVADSCTSCGVCAAICPQGSLQKREEMNPSPEDPTKEDRILSMQLIFEPQKCVHCQRCIETCRSQALSFSLKPLNHRLMTGKILIYEGSPRYCSRCGKRIFDNADLCLVCSTNDPDSHGFIIP